MKTIIVGAGMLGLSAADALQKEGAKVCVLEKESEPGGLCRGFDTGLGFHAEFYHHFITGADRELLEMIRRFGLDDRLVWSEAYTACKTESALVPLNTAMDLLRFPDVPFMQKFRFGWAMFGLRHVKEWLPLEQVPAVNWIVAKGGRRLYDRLWRRLFETKFDDKAGQVPLSWFWARVNRRVSKQKKGADVFGLLNGSLGHLTRALVKSIEAGKGEVRTDATVIRIEKDDGGFTVHLKGGGSESADKVIITTPLPVFVKMAPDLPDEYLSKCLAVQYSGIINAVFILKKSLSKYFWINSTAPGAPYSGIIETTRLLEGPKHHLVYMPRYRPTDSKQFDREKGAILDEYQAALQNDFPHVTDDDIVSRHLFRDRLADPYYTLEYSKLYPAHATPIKGLYCFNTAQIYPDTRSAGSSIKYGQLAAKMIAQSL